MKKFSLALSAGVLLALAIVVGSVQGQTPPPPPPPSFGPTSTPTTVPTPTSTPTPVPTATPIPLTLSVSLAHGKVKSGQTQKVTVSTLPNAGLTITAKFPSGSKDQVGAAANSSGSLVFSFVQPGGVTRGNNRTVSVSVKATSGTQSKSSTKKYSIS